MYNYIQGKIVDKTLTAIVVDNNGIGYEIGVSGNTLMDVDMGEIVKIYTYLYVREDEMSLYGFSRLEEKKLFMRLIDISGIGPKLAMQILGGYDLKTLTVAIASGDAKTLCKIKGLGKKTAELIILSLREQVAAISAGFLYGSEELHALSISAAPRKSPIMSMPSTAAGKSPTGQSSLKRPPTPSGI